MVNDDPLSEFTDPIWTILDILPTMLSYWDCDLQCRFANRAYEKWFGVKASTLFDSSLRDLLGPALFAESQPYIQGVLRGEPQEFDRIPSPRDVVFRPGLVNYLPHVVNGKVRGFVVQVTDVTRLRDLQAQLRLQVAETARACERAERSEAMLWQAQQLGRIGSWEWDRASGTTSWSPQLYELYGRDPALPPPTLAEHAALYTPESWKRLSDAVDRALGLGEAYTLELRYFHGGGSEGWLEARGVAVRGDQGAVVGLHGTVQEISARRMADSVGLQALRIAELEQELAQACARNAQLVSALARPDAPRWTPPPAQS